MNKIQTQSVGIVQGVILGVIGLLATIAIVAVNLLPFILLGLAIFYGIRGCN